LDDHTHVERIWDRMKIWMTVAAALMVCAGSASAQVNDAYHTVPRDTVNNDTYQGWKQFELNCSRCHGEYGVGTSFAPALVVSLKEGGTVPSQESFITTVCAGRPDKGMPSWCALGLEMDKIQRIYLYLKGRADGKIGIGRPAVRDNS
jgi:mono/diheme cytochrome c family protein